MKKTKNNTGAVVNRRASYDYALGDDLVAGIVLNGRETKAARLGHISLKGSYAVIKNDELWLVNASFTLANNEKGGGTTVDSSDRKLLVKKRELNKLLEARKNGMTIVPKKVLTNGRFIKIVIAAGKGKKQYDKRETIKRREFERRNLG